MSTPYTPSPVYHATTDITVDGDLANAGEFNTPLQELADNAEYLKQLTQPLKTGGVLTPTAPLELDQQLIVNAPVDIEGSLTVDNTAQVNSTLDVFGNATCHAQLTTEVAIVNNDLVVSGQTTHVGPTICVGDVTAQNVKVNGNTTLGDSDVDQLVVKATTIPEAPFLFGSFSAAARATLRTQVGVDGSSITYLEGTQVIFWGTTTLTASVAQSLLGSPGQPGDHILLSYYGGTHTLSFTFPGGLSISLGASGTHWSYQVLVAGIWRQVASGS